MQDAEPLRLGVVVTRPHVVVDLHRGAGPLLLDVAEEGAARAALPEPVGQVHADAGAAHAARRQAHRLAVGVVLRPRLAVDQVDVGGLDHGPATDVRGRDDVGQDVPVQVLDPAHFPGGAHVSCQVDVVLPAGRHVVVAQQATAVPGARGRGDDDVVPGLLRADGRAGYARLDVRLVGSGRLQFGAVDVQRCHAARALVDLEGQAGAGADGVVAAAAGVAERGGGAGRRRPRGPFGGGRAEAEGQAAEAGPGQELPPA